MHANLLPLVYDDSSVVRSLYNAQMMAPDQANAIHKLLAKSRTLDINTPDTYVETQLDVLARIRGFDSTYSNPQPRACMQRLLDGMTGIEKLNSIIIMCEPNNETCFADCMTVNRAIFQVMENTAFASATQTDTGHEQDRTKFHKHPNRIHKWEYCDLNSKTMDPQGREQRKAQFAARKA